MASLCDADGTQSPIHGTMLRSRQAAAWRKNVTSGKAPTWGQHVKPGMAREAVPVWEDASTIESYKQKVKQMFDGRPQTYDTGEIGAFHTSLARRLVEVANIKEGERILDVATGTGLVSLEAARLVGPSGAVIGLDISQGMLQQQQSKLDRAGIKNVTLMQGDVEAMELPAQSFDVIMCCSSLPYFSDIPGALARFRKWLKPSGHIAIQCFQSPQNEDYGLFCDMAVNEYGIANPDPNERLGSEIACAQLLRGAGFRAAEIHVEPGKQRTAAESVQQYAEGMWRRATSSPFWPEQANTSQSLPTFRSRFVDLTSQQAASRFSDGHVESNFIAMYILAVPT